MRKQIINDFEDVAQEVIEGYAAAYDRLYEKHPNVNGILLRHAGENKTALVLGGPIGHEPLWIGFVGEGLADAAACGGLLSAPDPYTIYQTAKAADRGKGVLLLHGSSKTEERNYEAAMEYLQRDGIPAACLRVCDDTASAPAERREERRSSAGAAFVIKIAGAACGAGPDLPEILRIAQKAADHTRSISLAERIPDFPGNCSETQTPGTAEIEYGLGLRGERGLFRTPMQPADILTDRMYNQIYLDFALSKGDEICVLVNSLGSVGIAELSIVYRRLQQLFDQDGIRVYDADLNYYCTSPAVSGFTITVLKLDKELKKYYDRPCHSPYFFRQKPAKQGKGTKKYAARVQSVQAQEAVTPPAENSGDGSREKLNALQVRDMLIHTAEGIIRQEALLTELNTLSGDGDHGILLAGGMRRVRTALQQMTDVSNVYEVFEAAGRILLLSMSGGSGVYFSDLFRAGAKGKKKKILTSEDFADLLEAGLAAIRKTGKANAGDRTMVDALLPAAEAAMVNRTAGMPAILRAAEEAAGAGAERTRNYPAKFGHGRRMKKAVLGQKDAGAVSLYLILQGMREYVEGET